MNRRINLARIDTISLKRSRPLEDVVAAYGIAMRHGGAGRYWSLCPFHQERTPSFCVDVRDPDDAHFHCFSCAAHGDVIDFVMRLEGCTFTEACERLTGRRRPERLGLSGESQTKRSSDRRWDLVSPGSPEAHVLDMAAEVFAKALDVSSRARDYLHKRGIPIELARTQRVGYADGRSLMSALQQHDVEPASDEGLSRLSDVALELGLLVKREDRHTGEPVLREFFFDRIVIPELRGGRPIWFIGRTVADTRSEYGGEPVAPKTHSRPKYLSLPGERPILGMERVLGHGSAYLVEGPFDWLAGVHWDLPVFAICGTHVPVERLPGFGAAVAIYGVFDPDRAGSSAAERFAPLLGPRWRPITLPNGMDLAELAARGEAGRELFRALVGRARATAWRQGRA